MEKTDHNKALIEMIHAIGELQSEIEHNYTSEEMFWIGRALRNMVYLMKHDKKECISLDVTNQLLRSAYISILTSAKRLKNGI